MKHKAFWPAVVGFALVVAFLAYRAAVPLKVTEPPSPVPAISVSALSELALTDTSGQAQNLRQWQGKILVINYWATWCQPCREEMPGFSRLQEKFRGNGVQFVGISTDEVDKIIDFQKMTPVNYPLLIGSMAVMASSANLGNIRQGLPFTAVFDRRGDLAMTKLGRWNEADLEPKLAELAAR
jgi:peroxiredoxin